jgi:hypothetical protein
MANPNRSRNSTAQEQRPQHQQGVVGAIHRVARLRSEGRSWAEVCQELGATKGTAQRAAMSVSASASMAD